MGELLGETGGELTARQKKAVQELASLFREAPYGAIVPVVLKGREHDEATLAELRGREIQWLTERHGLGDDETNWPQEAA